MKGGGMTYSYSVADEKTYKYHTVESLHFNKVEMLVSMAFLFYSVHFDIFCTVYTYLQTCQSIISLC